MSRSIATVEPLTLITTKLHRSPVTGNLVSRPRLIDQLNRGLSGPLTLVCAPAGFGKSTLVNSWIESMGADKGGITPPLPAAWLSLDENDSDLSLFLRYFVAALHTIFPDACVTTLDLLRAPKQPTSELILATLTNELAHLPRRFVFVLDDYHMIGGAAVHDLLNGLIHHRPQAMHLVLISRNNPPLPLPSLRAKGQVAEIRSHDLRFTLEEAIAFMAGAAPRPLSQSAVTLLEQRTEGWIAGLQLAALSLAAADDAEVAVLTLASDDAGIADFLMDEVLSQQPPAIQEFLLMTSILDRFCGALCEAIVGVVAGDQDLQFSVRACMDWLARANLFVILLDNNREWYRYHHLFRELLQRRLLAEVAPERVTDLHRRAATWFAGQGLMDEALRHALAANDLDLAARLMEQGLCDVLNREDRPTLERWLYLLPEEFIQHRPGVLMLKVWVLQLSWQLDAQWRLLQQVEALLTEEGASPLTDAMLRVIRGQLLIFYGQAAYFRSEMTAAVAFCEEALSLLPPSWMYARGAISVYLGLAMQASGQGRVAERLLLDRYEALRDKTTNYSQRLLMAVSFIYLQDGQLEQVRQTAQTMLQQATQSGLLILQCWAHYLLGVAHYQQNELGAARQHFAAVIANRHVTQALTVTGSLIGLVLTQQARGERAEACETLDVFSQYDLLSKGTEDQRTRSLRARVLLLQGDVEGATRWADTLTSSLPAQPLLWLEEPHLTKARILLARGSDGDAQSALGILNALYEIAQRTTNIRFQIEILALRALALDVQGEPSEALAALQRAVELSRPGGFIRAFVDSGPGMQALLHRLSRQGFAVETVRRILAAFPTPRKESEIRAANSGLIEPLTGRELDVLALLRERLSNREIALKLGLSILTVKRHTVNLYGKLGVNRRWDAVIKAENLGILPPR